MKKIVIEVSNDTFNRLKALEKVGYIKDRAIMIQQYVEDPGLYDDELDEYYEVLDKIRNSKK